jgi:AcrR family transcriptional regulator
MAPNASAPTTKLRKSDRTRQAILDGARIAFARKGFSGVTIQDITELAQVTRANFYYYFRDKRALFIELGTATYREALDVAESFSELGDMPGKDAIHDWVARYFAYLDRNGAFVIRSAEDSPDDQKFRAARARSYRRTAQALGDRIAKLSAIPPEVDSAAIGLATMAMLERSWLMAQHNEIPTMSQDMVVAALAELISRLVDSDKEP